MEKPLKEPVSQTAETEKQGRRKAVTQPDALETLKREIVATHNRAVADKKCPHETIAPLVLEFIEKGGDPNQLVKEKILGVENPPLW